MNMVDATIITIAMSTLVWAYVVLFLLAQGVCNLGIKLILRCRRKR